MSKYDLSLPFGDGLEVYGHGLGKLVLQKWPCLHRWCVCVCVCVAERWPALALYCITVIVLRP